jgi:hypothetical protein
MIELLQKLIPNNLKHCIENYYLDNEKEIVFVINKNIKYCNNK